MLKKKNAKQEKTTYKAYYVNKIEEIKTIIKNLSLVAIGNDSDNESNKIWLRDQMMKS